MARKSDPLAFGGLALLTLIWSFSWIAMKQVTSYIGAFDFTALRCIFGAVVLWIVMLIRGKALKPTPFGYTWRSRYCKPAAWSVWHSGR